MTFESVSMKETEPHDDVKECMICHCGPNDNNEQTLLTVMLIKNLVRECSCEYVIHEECLEEWLASNPVCPICNEFTYYGVVCCDDEQTTSQEQHMSSTTKCLYRLLCCMASPEAVRNPHSV